MPRPDTELAESEAAHALWNAAVLGANMLRRSWDVRMYLEQRPRTQIADSTGGVPALPVWKLTELLSVVAVLTRANTVVTTTMANLAGSSGPVQYRTGAQDLWLWTQPSMKGTSELVGRPDLVLTNTGDPPGIGNNVVQVVESKAGRTLGAQGIRGEFAKAHDLRVASYLIWSLHVPRPELVMAARRLGIDLEAVPFPEPGESQESAAAKLLFAFGETIHAVQREGAFAKLLQSAAEAVETKLLR